MPEGVDIAIVGGGVIGCAVASALAGTRSVLLLEAGPRMGEGVTSRNSGVVHSGLYYPPESRKARTCVRGQALLYEWAAKKGVAHSKCGKLVLAWTEAQLAGLEALLENARASGAVAVERVGPEFVRAREPSLPPTIQAALWCPESGVVDPAELTRSLLVDAEAKGATALTHARVTAIAASGAGWRLESTRGEIEAGKVINAAGLHADDIAAMAGITRYKIHPCRGDYFYLATKAKYTHLLYPVKDPASPGLGVHLTLDLAGRYRLGPDAEYVAGKEDVSAREDKRDAFHTAAEKLLGPLDPAALSYDSCGIRPKLRGPADPAEVDFVVAEDLPGFVSLVGIESPGLTSALALAEDVFSLLA